PTNQDVLKKLGADVTIDYTKEKASDVAKHHTDGKGVDTVFDTSGGENILQSIPGTRPFGRLACILTPAGTLAGLSSKNQTLYGIFLMRESARLREMTSVIEQGKMKSLVHEVLPLEEVRKAHERLDSGHGTGKIVLRVADK